MFKLFVLAFAALLAVVAAKPGLVSSYVAAAPAVAYSGHYASPYAYSAGYGYGYAAPYAYSGHYGYGYAARPYSYYY